ncbi:MAG TPA: Kdo hydroxylase family protein [Nitrococcus sp.]|nr:Kdo hydroxylase family protein [Nitrococcus sp.]
MEVLETFADATQWSSPNDEAAQARAVSAIEGGKILYFPALAFPMDDVERVFLSSDCTDGKAKNISYDPRVGTVQGTSCSGAQKTLLVGMMRRYGDCAQQLLLGLIPGYRPGLERARTSYRPVEVEGRQMSRKKNDALLHVDAFPSRPNQGRRIMRVFTNVNPHGRSRVWHVGEPFEAFATKFLPTVSPPRPGAARLLQWSGLTKSLRTRYDHTMLQLHDNGKLDDAYQTNAPRERVEFPPGATWIVYTDQVLHAALAGQYVFEQTFHLDVESLTQPATSPLRVLERLTGRPLVA